MTAARASGLPLRLLEPGTSAGLHLRWDRFRYHAGPLVWGDPGSPVDLGDPFQGLPPPLGHAATVVERRGADRSPVDPTTLEGELTLLSYVWADQGERIGRLRAAIDGQTRYRGWSLRTAIRWESTKRPSRQTCRRSVPSSVKPAFS